MELPSREQVDAITALGVSPYVDSLAIQILDAYNDGTLMTKQEVRAYLDGPDYELFAQEVEWCHINGVPRWAESVSDWDRHQANDDARDARRHGTVLLVSPSSLAAALGEIQ